MTDTTYTRPGRPGASAQRAYEALARQAEAWAIGAAGERAVARRLRSGRRAIVLSDRAWPGRRANLDHIVVGRSGVFVIDAKAHRGRVELVDHGSFLRPSPRLHVAGRDRTDLVSAVRRQAALVTEMVARSGVTANPVPVVPALCFVGSQWSLPSGWVSVGSVMVAEVGSIRRLVLSRGPLRADDRSKLAQVLDEALPPR